MKETIMDALTEPLKEIDVVVSDVRFEKEDGVDTLFITIDSSETIDTDLCVKATNIINPIIDSLELEELDKEYVLDVCSREGE